MGTLLLADIREAFHLRPDGTVSPEPVSKRLPTEVILRSLCEREDRPWADFRRGRPLWGGDLARMLRPYGVGPRNLKLHHGLVCKGYLLESLAEAFARYLHPLGAATPLPRPPTTTYDNNALDRPAS